MSAPSPWWPPFLGNNEPHDVGPWGEPPPWRRFGREDPKFKDLKTAVFYGKVPDLAPSDVRKGQTYRALGRAVDAVNAALLLRRPLLVTGEPGTGKSSLAAAVAHELKLGRVLNWPVTSRTTLDDGLYRYDAVARLHDAQVGKGLGPNESKKINPNDLTRYVRLGPVGTAMLPQMRPRVLLVDELDKADPDLPNDLLNLFEEGRFKVPVLESQCDDDVKDHEVRTDDRDGPSFKVVGGAVLCYEFPFVVVTSNGDREFPPAFLRRCVQLSLDHRPNEDRKEWLKGVVQAHFPNEAREEEFLKTCDELIEKFVDPTRRGRRATDQLLNAVALIVGHNVTDRAPWYDLLYAPLDPEGPR